MFLQHNVGIMDEEAFHMLDVKGLVFSDAAVGACVSAIMYVNGDLPDSCDPCEEDDSDDELDLSS